MALETWRDADENTPVTLLLARKLRLLAASNTKLEFTAGDILREHARYVEFMQRRIGGLEAAISARDSAERNAQILSLKRQIAERDRQVAELNKAIDGFLNSKSWRLTLPFRKAKSFAERERRRMNSLWLFGRV
jgi:hypothetical protein